MTDDGTNQYLYDAENRLCAVYNYTGSGARTGYLYGADGNRLGKGPITSWSCDVVANGFSFANIYAVGPSGGSNREDVIVAAPRSGLALYFWLDVPAGEGNVIQSNEIDERDQH